MTALNPTEGPVKEKFISPEMLNGVLAAVRAQSTDGDIQLSILTYVLATSARWLNIHKQQLLERVDLAYQDPTFRFEQAADIFLPQDGDVVVDLSALTRA